MFEVCLLLEPYSNLYTLKHVGNSIVHVNTMLKLDQYTLVYMGRWWQPTVICI